MNSYTDPTKTVTVLAPHACSRCGRTIAANTHGVLVESGVRRGECYRRYVCPACQAKPTGGKGDGRG